MQKSTLPNFLIVKKSNTYQGTTIFATKKIPKEHIICTTSITNMDYQDGCIMSPFGDVFWHSDKPNAKIKINEKCNMKIDIVSVDEIGPGDEITVNYENNTGKTLTRAELLAQLNSKK